MSKKPIIITSIIIGVILILLAIFYWITPAGSLPALVPGFEAGSAHIHFKHGLGSFILGLVLFAYAWFTSGKKEVK